MTHLQTKFVPYFVFIQRFIPLIFLLIWNLQVHSQNTNRINLNFQDRPLAEVLNSIEEQTSFRIIFNTSKINPEQVVSINVQNVSVRQALNILFRNLPVNYVIREEQILLVEDPSTTAATLPGERLISGRVVSAWDGSPLPGATILIKNTGVGALTNMEGEFTYLVKTADIPNTELEIKFIGMRTQTVRLGENTSFLIQMEELASELDQVVITSSYGTRKLREEVVGSIATINADDIAVNQAVESIDKMLEGQLAGVLIENTSGIGGPVKINVRGQGSLTPLGNLNLGTSTQPLIILDGVVMTEEMAIDNNFFDGSGSFSENLNNPLSQIAAEDIESISVLKDAAAVSIYGADGANGVIIITTKKGKTSKPQFGFTTQAGVSEAINQIQYLSGDEFVQLRNEYLRNRGQSEIPNNGINTNWFELMNRTGLFQKYNFNVGGATPIFNYRSSLSYTAIDEPQVGNGSQQVNMNVNLGYSRDRLDMSLSLTPGYIRRETPNIYYNFAFTPNLAPYEEDGTFADLGVNGLANPLAAAEQNLNQSDTYSILGSLNIGYELFNNFTVSTLFGINIVDKDQDRYFSAANESGRFNGNFTLNGEVYPRWGRRILNERNSTKWNWQNQVFYEKQFENHGLDLLAGVELSEEKTDFNYSSGRGFVNPERLNDISEALQDDDPNSAADERLANQSFDSDINYNSRVSFYSQLNYDYLGKYFFLGNFRRDQSSVFGTDTDVAYNGGAGVSWIISKENFLINSTWLDFLKLKTSYGTTGNSRIGSYRSRGLYETGIAGYNGLDYAYPFAAPNPRLSWEKNTKFNAGIDLNLFKRIRLSAEYYYDDIEDLITSRDLPTETGYSSLQLNAASMYNKGIELSASVDWFKYENFSWTSSFNLATLESEVTSLQGLGSDFSIAANALAQKVGYSTSTIWGVNWVGIDPGTGRDLLEKDGQVYDAVTYRSLFNDSDWVPIGDRQPDVYGGFSNTITINRNFSIAIRGSYQYGGEYMVTHDLISNYNLTFNRNLSVNAFDYWRNQGDVASQPVVTNNPVFANLDKYVYDASFIKLSNINITYHVPIDPNKLFLDKLSVFVDASNVAYWYKDEAPEGMNGIKEFRFIYPQARTISLGLKTNF